jgi:hypothetical protein
MKNSTAILMIMTVLAAASACRAEHPLDEAAQALASGDAARAVEVYRQAVTDDPTSEGLNNFGAALERSGQFAEAAEAYAEAMLLPDAGDETEANLKRARLRALAQFSLPYAACLFGGLLAVFLLVWLVKRLVRAWRAWQFRMQFRGVRAAGLTHRVQCRDSQYQPDGRAYPDSESISLKADLVLPERLDIYPLHLELEVARPDGAVWRTLREEIEAPQAERVTFWFQLDQIGELLGHSGTWNARLILRNTDRRLAATAFTVVSHADLVADLKATGVALLAVRGDRTEPAKAVFPDEVEAVVPTAVIRPKTFHASKFAGMQLRLDLVNVDKQDDVESQEFPLEMADGRMEFCSVSRPIAQDDIARKLGRWEFRLSAEGRQLARMPFVIVSVQQALESLKIESFDLAGTTRDGKVSAVGSVAYVMNLRSLCPMVKLTSKLPSPRAGFQMTMGVCVDGEPVGGVEGTLVMDRNVEEMVPGEFTPPPIPEGRDSMKVSFVLLVEGRNLGVREVMLRSRPPRCADAQGRISETPGRGEIDYDSEAARILDEARVR